MTDKNLSLLLYKTGELRVVDRPIPEPDEGEVQISIDSVGVCGTDTHMWKERSLGALKVIDPLVLGHEAAGVVTKLGRGVTSLRIGDRVAVEPIVPCFQCSQCLTGHYNVCPDIRIPSLPTFQPGSFSRYKTHTAAMCHKLPDHVTMEEGAMLEPLAVAVHAVERVGIKLGNKVLVTGGGSIGMLTMMTAKVGGASQICVTDIDEKRLELAKQFGADFAVNVKNLDPKDAAAKVKEVMGSPADVSFDCVGIELALNTAIYSTRAAGRVGCVGVEQEMRNIDVHHVITHELDVFGVLAYANNYPTALKLVASGKLDIKPLVTHRIPLETAQQALELAEKGEGLKIMVKCARQ